MNLCWLVINFVWSMDHAIPIQISTVDFVANFCSSYLGVNASELPIDPVLGVPARIVGPFAGLFKTGLTWSSMLRNLAGGLLNVAIWSFFGLAIVRIAVVQCGKQQRVSTRDALRFSVRNWLNVAGAPTMTLFAIMLMAIPVFAVSWLLRFDFGVLLIGVGWILILASSVFMTILAAGLALGWPLMWGSIAAEDSDVFDAVSRSFAYTYQRPGNYLAYLALAACLGVLGWVMACLLSEVAIQLAYWSIQFGGGADRTQLLRGLVQGKVSADAVSDSLSSGANLVRGVNGLLSVLASGFSFSFFWSAIGAIYLLLRFDTDRTSFDDVISNHQVETEAASMFTTVRESPQHEGAQSASAP